MGPTKIQGLPAHVLLVHLVLAAVPIAALVLVVAALWPTAARRLGIITPIIALGALLTVPVTTHAGQWLEARVTITPLIRKHVTLGKEVLPWMIGLFVIALLVWLWSRTDSVALHGTLGRVVVGVLAVAISVGAVQQVVRTGEAGSRALWTGNFSDQPTK
jgi:O-antigen/teichoic acid export membrane protein